MAASIINDVTGYANSISGIIADSYVALKAFNDATENGTRNTRTWVNLAIAAVNIAMSISDVLENLIACTIIKNSDSDYSFVKRTKENNYISGHDIYLMTTSSVRMTAMIANASLLMADNMASTKISSLELNATSTDLTSSGFNITGVMNTTKATVMSGTDTDLIKKIDVNDDQPNDISNLISKATLISVKGTTTNLANITEKALEDSSTSNLDQKRVDGNSIINVHEDETSAQKNQTHGNKNEGTLSTEKVNGNDNKVDANKIDGNANQVQTNAVGTQTEAVENSAGALQTDTKAMEVG